MTTVADAINAALLAEQEREAEQAAAIARALEQSTAPPIDINPLIKIRVVDNEDLLNRANRQVFIGSVPDLHNLPSVVFSPVSISGQQAYLMQVYVP